MRWTFLVTASGSPFSCEECGAAMREARNCSNSLGLPDEVRIVEDFTPGVLDEIRRCGAKKVFSLGSLRFYECPLTAISAETMEMIGIVYLVEASGRLYYSGGWADQPCWLVEAYEIFKRERHEYLKGRENGES